MWISFPQIDKNFFDAPNFKQVAIRVLHEMAWGYPTPFFLYFYIKWQN